MWRGGSRAQLRIDHSPDWRARRRPKPPSSESTPCPTPCRARMPGHYSKHCDRRPCVGGLAPVAPARLFVCVRCRTQVLICSCCDRGQIYCAGGCAQEARYHAQRAAGLEAAKSAASSIPLPASTVRHGKLRFGRSAFVGSSVEVGRWYAVRAVSATWLPPCRESAISRAEAPPSLSGIQNGAPTSGPMAERRLATSRR
jgi:hypothetical protein